MGPHPPPPHWEHGVLVTGPPGKSLKLAFDNASLKEFLVIAFIILRAIVPAGPYEGVCND